MIDSYPHDLTQTQKKKELNSDKAAEPMYMHNETAAQHLVSSGNGACSE